MELKFFKKKIKAGAKRYEKETGIVPEIYEIAENEDDQCLITIHFSSMVKYAPSYGSKTGLTPHLQFTFDPSGLSKNKFKWDGLKRWNKLNKEESE